MLIRKRRNQVTDELSTEAYSVHRPIPKQSSKNSALALRTHYKWYLHQPPSPSLAASLRSIKSNPQGLFHLAYDGVYRSYNGNGRVIDYRQFDPEKGGGLLLTKWNHIVLIFHDHDLSSNLLHIELLSTPDGLLLASSSIPNRYCLFIHTSTDDHASRRGVPARIQVATFSQP